MEDTVILRLEVEGMKHTMLTAIQAKHLEIEAKIAKACEEYCAGPELGKAIEEALAATIKREIQSYFAYGDGAEVIGGVVRKAFAKRKA